MSREAQAFAYLLRSIGEVEEKMGGELLQVCRTMVNSVPECCRSPCALPKPEIYRHFVQASAVKKVPFCMKSFVLVGAWNDASTCHFRAALWPCSSRFPTN